jgi:ABC-type multidrug transport system fused ATPase/permease subunit
MAFLGAVSGLGETAVVILAIALVSGRRLAHYPLAGLLPSSPWAVAGLALAVVAILAAGHVGAAHLAARAGADVQRAGQSALVASYLDAPWPAQAATRLGELQDLATVKVGILAYGAQETAQGLAGLVNLAVVVVAAIVLSPYAAAGLLAAVGAGVLISRPLRRRRRRLIRAATGAASELAVEITETAVIARDLRVFGVTAEARGRLGARIEETARRLEAVRLLSGASAPLTRDVTVALLILGLAVVVGEAGVGLAALGATVLLILRAVGHAQSVTSIGVRLQERDESLARIETSLAAWRPWPSLGRRSCPRVETLELREVTYTHPGAAQPALERVSLRLTRGEMVGIVGRTGAGKSTLAGALLGLLEPDSGAVLGDGVPLRDLDPGDWHARTAWVGQEPHLLTATVGENIRFLRPSLSDAAVAEAARAAGLSSEVEGWPGGLDHPVGPAGSSLSGGERQRVALARALAGRPDLLVLDEPTSALDAHAEAAVRTALERLRRELIVVVIAHRISTIRTCDRVAVMAEGRISALAAPAELEQGNAYFQEVVSLGRQ